ncbi:MAG: FHA domain-containing protein [Coriobacteriia bacterium]|nr:FHA domain-containing protein [Coriobacteriia bacterium]
MVDIILLFGKLVFLALMYLFLFAAVRAGLGLVGGPSAAPARVGGLALAVTRGPAELRGVKVPLKGPVVVGRSPEADIVIADDFVSSKHARVVLAGGGGAVLEDLGSTNGTLLNGRRVTRSVPLKPGDLIGLGTVELRLERS